MVLNFDFSVALNFQLWILFCRLHRLFA
jgi:hypothetical protein